MRLPERIQTERLTLRRPSVHDAETVFALWASDPEATRYMSWARHESLDDTLAFLSFCDEEWDRWPAAAYLIEQRSPGGLIGSCGFTFTEATRAQVGYILKSDAWGRGYATESMLAQIGAADEAGAFVLEAAVHPANAASIRVLEKCGFCRDPHSDVPIRFPNLPDNGEVLALAYARTLP